jgi:hypothetical protein
VIPGHRPAPPLSPESLNPTPRAFPAVPNAGIPTPPVTRRAMVPPEPDETKAPPRPAPSAATAGILPKLPVSGPGAGATIREKPGPLSELAAQSSRKTMEIAVDRSLIDASAAPASGRPTVEVPPTPKVAPPPPAASSHKALDLELDSPWDEGWDDVPEPKK